MMTTEDKLRAENERLHLVLAVIRDELEKKAVNWGAELIALIDEAKKERR